MQTPKVIRDIYYNAQIADVYGKISITAGLRWARARATPMHVEQIVVEGPLDGRIVVWRGLRIKGKWCRLAPVAGTIEALLLEAQGQRG